VQPKKGGRPNIDVGGGGLPGKGGKQNCDQEITARRKIALRPKTTGEKPNPLFRDCAEVEEKGRILPMSTIKAVNKQNRVRNARWVRGRSKNRKRTEEEKEMEYLRVPAGMQSKTVEETQKVLDSLKGENRGLRGEKGLAGSELLATFGGGQRLLRGGRTLPTGFTRSRKYKIHWE